MIEGLRRFTWGDLVDAVPHNNLLLRFCRRYVDHFNGDNNGDMRKNGELLWLMETAPQCHTVFDVGANIGDWAACALKINPSLEVHCFEPCPHTFSKLEQRKLTGLGNSKIYLNCIGMSDNPGEAKIHVYGNEAGTNSLYKREGLLTMQEGTEQKIRLDTIDNYCEREGVSEIDIMKIDVEGHELNVLKGAVKMLREKRIPFIQFEYGGTYIDARILLKDMFGLLQSYQYRLYKISPKGLRLYSHYEQKLENFQYSNWVAAR